MDESDLSDPPEPKPPGASGIGGADIVNITRREARCRIGWSLASSPTRTTETKNGDTRSATVFVRLNNVQQVGVAQRAAWGWLVECLWHARGGETAAVFDRLDGGLRGCGGVGRIVGKARFETSE